MGFSRQEYWSGLPSPPPWERKILDQTRICCTANRFVTAELPHQNSQCSLGHSWTRTCSPGGGDKSEDVGPHCSNASQCGLREAPTASYEKESGSSYLRLLRRKQDTEA